MANVRAKGGNLFFDFRYQGIRCREYTKQPDTPANRKRMQRVVEKLDTEIALGQFEYAKFFPGSANAAKFAASAPGGAEKAQPAAPLYREFAETWYLEGEPLWRRSHRATIRSTLDRHLVPEFGHQAVADISKADCLAFRARLAKLPGRGGHATLSAKTINRIIQMHGQILGEAAERFDFINPVDRIKRLKQPKVDIHPFSLTEVQRMIQTIRADYRNYLITRLFTGLRSGEINGLQWRYVDFERRQILVRETLVRGEKEYTKTDGSQREVSMSQPVYDALQAQRAVTGDLAGFVFCTRSGEPIDLDNFTNRVWYPLLRYLELEKRRPYQTRHTAATLWLASGENPEWVARQLGHANTEMLFKTYSRYVPNLTRSDGAAMDRLLAANLHTAPSKNIQPSTVMAPPHPPGAAATLGDQA